ncbi:MAG TPA: MerR family transcriptional regulator [Devosiaceae bacterium]|jgi:DNA-binding transcriptional MerR regulator|nr:MerR family transcriptional regulator [Devosiaceae bacterium]
MKMLTVKELAKLAGVSVRTLHHYDAIGLLKPALTGNNRYRYYGRVELLRLQQILIHRELDIPLAEIAAILDAPGFDRLATLEEQRRRLQAEAERYSRLVRTIDRTIASIKGDREMRNADLYKGLSPEKQAEYEQWLVDSYGGDMPERIVASRRRMSQMDAAEQAAHMAELASIEQGLAEGLRRGVAAESPSLGPLLRRHRDWVAGSWGQPCPPEAYAGLADLYLGHPDFVARYEQIEPGFAAYLSTAMKAWAGRQDC